MPATLADTTLRLLDDLPVYERGSNHVQAVLDACATEIDRLDGAVNQIRANFFPATADVLLSLYETELGLSVNPPDKTLDERRISVQAFIRKLRSTGSGLSWQQNLSTLIGSGWTYEEHDPGDPASPPANTIRIILPYGAGLPTPAPPTLTTGAGTLPAGTYYYAITAQNTYGETLASGTTSVTIATAQQVNVAWTAVTGATSYGIFRGTTATNLTRIATVAASPYADNGGQTPGTPPPTANTTQGYQAHEAQVLARQVTPAHIDLQYGYSAGFIIGVSNIGDVL